MNTLRDLMLIVLGVTALTVQPGHAETVLITGANTGIGLEFAKEYAARNWTVIATHRHEQVPDTLAGLASEHSNVRVERMDVTSEQEVDALADKLQGVPIDVLINNAAVYASGDYDFSSQTFGTFDFALMDTIMAVNVKGPLMVAQAFIKNIEAGRQKKLVSISSTTGSLTRPYPGTGGIFYRASKAALNKEMQTVAEALRPDGVIVLLLHPGVVRTERFQLYISKSPGARPDAVDLPVSVGHMIKTIDKATIHDTGHWLRYDGVPLPW